MPSSKVTLRALPKGVLFENAEYEDFKKGFKSLLDYTFSPNTSGLSRCLHTQPSVQTPIELMKEAFALFVQWELLSEHEYVQARTMQYMSLSWSSSRISRIKTLPKNCVDTFYRARAEIREHNDGGEEAVQKADEEVVDYLLENAGSLGFTVDNIIDGAKAVDGKGLYLHSLVLERSKLLSSKGTETK